MSKKRLTILCLYPDQMNFYGDMGNVLALQRRLEWRGMEAAVLFHHPGDAFPSEPVDIVVGGGGQDSGQLLVYQDLLAIGPALHVLAERDVPMLMVCGLYQLFGKRFVTSDGKELEGIGMFDLETFGQGKRLVSNCIVRTPFGDVVGYENHSGRTVLAPGQKSFGTVVKGFGNDGTSGEEGAVHRNVYGTYLHGAMLPRNPRFADALLAKALRNRYGETPLAELNDTNALAAARVVYKLA